MIIKKIYLENIRSFEKGEIEFSTGRTLLSGNIGSGKTSILLAIEFALFGLQPGQKGTSLLRNGTYYGRVIMDFQVEGKEIIVERTLKRGKSVNQDYCSITLNGQKEELSVTELKNKILDILAYPSDLVKKQNILYRFTVYTPQEEMKEIILENSETRIDTLRQVFGMDKYKRILENVAIIISKLKEERKVREGMTIGIEQDKVLLKKKEEDLSSLRKKLFFLKKEFEKKHELKKEIDLEMEGIYLKQKEKNNFIMESDKLKMILKNKEVLIEDNEKTQKKLLEQIKEIESIEFSQELIQEKEAILLKFRKMKEELLSHNLDIGSRMHALSLRNDENENTKGKLKNIEVCPTCLQDVSENYKQNIFKQIESNNLKNISDIKFLSKEREENLKKISEVDEKISAEETTLQELKLIKLRQNDVVEKLSKIDELKKLNEKIFNEITETNSQISSVESKIFDLKKFDIIYENKEKELEKASREERSSEIMFAEAKKEIEMFSYQIDELKERIVRMDEIRVKLNYFVELEDWLGKKFSPLISHIERSMMARLKKEFSTFFTAWFNVLVSDNFDISLSDDFSPLVRQQDYEIDYEYLSGGERTAIALSYRLALTQTINSLMSKVKTKNIVILDEPTDGFSDSQLDKMRDVLDELKVEQLIIVSHEQKIEGFVDNVIRLSKEYGISGKE